MQDDFEQIEIKNSVSGSSPLPPKTKFGPPAPRLRWVNRKHFIKFAVAFLAILVLAGGGYYAWQNYLSPSARSARQAEANYQKYLDWQKNYEAAMKADTYGGKTPEETLVLFADALEKGDTELASKYFVLDNSGSADPKIKESVQKIILENRVLSVTDMLNKLQPSTHEMALPGGKEFVVLKQDGTVDYSLIMRLNTYSNVWKIESM